VHGQGLVGLLATEHKIHAVFGLGVAHFDRATVNLNSKASLEHGCSSVDGDKVHEAKAAAQVAAALAHDAHLSDAGAVPREHGQNGIFVGVDVETLEATSRARKNEGVKRLCSSCEAIHWRGRTFTIKVSQGLLPSSTCRDDQSVFAAEGSTSSALGSRGELHCLQAPRCEMVSVDARNGMIPKSHMHH
jgi:hypothetical protein